MLAGCAVEAMWFILTVQKVVPLLVCCTRCSGGLVILFCGVLRVFVGSFRGLGCNSFRGLLRFSSILHTGWFLGACLAGVVVVLGYFFCYFGVVRGVCWAVPGDFYLFEAGGGAYAFGAQWGLCLSVLSLGGFPPLLGFFGKFLVLVRVVDTYPLFSFFIVVGSITSWYYYLHLFCFFVLNVGSWWGRAKVDALLPVSIFGGALLAPFFVF